MFDDNAAQVVSRLGKLESLILETWKITDKGVSFFQVLWFFAPLLRI